MVHVEPIRNVELLLEPVDPPPGTFEAFFQAEHARLQRAAFVLTGSDTEAEEIMQESFLKLWERWDRLQTIEDPTGYLYRTARNLWRSRRRRALRAARHLLQPRHHDPIAEADERESVRRALDDLPSRQRAAIVLTEVAGHSSEEAARILGVTASTVRSMTQQARSKLKASLEDSE